MRIVIPPLKSQGIKTKLVPWIRALTPQIGGRWIEPFFGTGVVAFNSGCREALLGDVNPHIIRFYQSVKNRKITPGRVRQFLNAEGAKLETSADDGYAYYLSVRERFNANHDPLDFLFLSRACFNGMMCFNRKGCWNVPFCQKPKRFSPAYITKIANQVHDVARIIQPRWTFQTASFENIIAQATQEDLIYCDPPYIGRYVDFFNGWSDADECRLYELLDATEARFILSTWHHNDYRENPYVAKLWSKFNIVTRDHFYHSGGKIENRRSIVEALVFNFPANLREHNHDFKRRRTQMLLPDIASRCADASQSAGHRNTSMK